MYTTKIWSFIFMRLDFGRLYLLLYDQILLVYVYTTRFWSYMFIRLGFGRLYLSDQILAVYVYMTRFWSCKQTAKLKLFSYFVRTCDLVQSVCTGSQLNTISVLVSQGCIKHAYLVTGFKSACKENNKPIYFCSLASLIVKEQTSSYSVNICYLVRELLRRNF